MRGVQLVPRRIIKVPMAVTIMHPRRRLIDLCTGRPSSCQSEAAARVEDDADRGEEGESKDEFSLGG